MTNEELAKHWNVSLDEAKNISDFMNKTFYMTTGQKAGDRTFYGCIYEKFRDGSIRPVFTLSANSNSGFETEKEAIESLNKVPERIKIPDARARLMGVPQDAFIALKRIEQQSTVGQKAKVVCMFRTRDSRG